MNRAFIGAVVAVSTLLAAPIAAHAVPNIADKTPTTSAQATQQLAQLATANEKLTEQYNQAQIDITAARRLASTATADAAAASAKLHVAQRALATSLASQYKAPSFSRTAALLSSNSTQGYLETIQSLRLLSEHQGEVATIAAAATAEATRSAATAKAAVATAEAKAAALAQQRSDLSKKIVTYKALLATLTAAERKAYLDAHPPAPAQVAQVLASAPTVAAQAAQTTSVPTSSPAPSGGAAAAIAAARAQLGKPYVWGAAGPGSFDCSGLTMWAWAAAGVSLPHNAAAQQGMGTPVSQSNLAPGDLVFFGSPAYHVALYIGGGLIIHAPTTGDVVKIASLSYMSDYSGATRLG